MRRIKLAYFFILLFFSVASTASEIVRCDGVSGFKVVTNYKPDDTAYITKTLTDIYTSNSDDQYMTHIALDNSHFANSNPFIVIEVLNSNKELLKKYRLGLWVTDRLFPGQRISKTNYAKFMSSKVAVPYDLYANLSRQNRSKVDINTIPFDARVTIFSEQNTICSFDFKYGSISEY